MTKTGPMQLLTGGLLLLLVFAGPCPAAAKGLMETNGTIRIGQEDGMQDFTMSLKGLIDDELIDRPTAFAVAPNKDALKMALKGIDVKAPGIL